MLWNFLRLRVRPPEKGPPPKNFADVSFNPETGKIHAINSQGEEVYFNSGGGSSDYQVATRDQGDSISLVNEIAASAVGITLPAGEWDVEGFVQLETTVATTSLRGVSFSTTNNTHGSVFLEDHWPTTANTTGGVAVLPRERFVLTETTTVYAVVTVLFSSGTVKAFGRVTARRF